MLFTIFSLLFASNWLCICKFEVMWLWWIIVTPGNHCLTSMRDLWFSFERYFWYIHIGIMQEQCHLLLLIVLHSKSITCIISYKKLFILCNSWKTKVYHLFNPWCSIYLRICTTPTTRWLHCILEAYLYLEYITGLVGTNNVFKEIANTWLEAWFLIVWCCSKFYNILLLLWYDFWRFSQCYLEITHWIGA